MAFFQPSMNEVVLDSVTDNYMETLNPPDSKAVVEGDSSLLIVVKSDGDSQRKNIEKGVQTLVSQPRKNREFPLLTSWSTSFEDLMEEDNTIYRYICDAGLKVSQPREILCHFDSVNGTRTNFETLKARGYIDDISSWLFTSMVDKDHQGGATTYDCIRLFMHPIKYMSDLRVCERKSLVNLFIHQIFIPIIYDFHWILSVIDFNKYNIKVFDSMKAGSSSERYQIVWQVVDFCETLFNEGFFNVNKVGYPFVYFPFGLPTRRASTAI
ncbi:Peptidase_C48 domain-containing protein [Cephalotus follicularis]|uniref:Peptidase_C48 domain-containing protein n=1 Tax=Cephalotus follicularis TaxID=3775 RepID=A0A1Q3C851_CEPFO|nr:Peptidase_C48 domain-containing protein [Cephalotus follicularis]